MVGQSFRNRRLFGPRVHDAIGCQKKGCRGKFHLEYFYSLENPRSSPLRACLCFRSLSALKRWAAFSVVRYADEKRTSEFLSSRLFQQLLQIPLPDCRERMRAVAASLIADRKQNEAAALDPLD